MSGYYDNATICLNGHVSSSRSSNYTKHCKTCGETTISNCESCNASIQGKYIVPGVLDLASKYKRPAYCHNCGLQYPWTSRVIENAIELLALDEDLPDDHKETIKLALPDLLVEKPSTPVAIAKYKKYIDKTQSYIKDGLKNILVDVVSETVKKSIWG
ncbi:DUF2321 domain-containing protein [Lysinibacillus agricola]|uniref:DUF2321 domain-containing protein n=1 Tax=Lysinibacillus agricola TaxID=2590012 RepID=A0ABX7AV85_9BACI|nr:MULTISPECIES: DUF2321 domain-containing protein [Lysinibacillus]KOS61715.1 hypothetical protein AN161_16230 [Lysinibacillus sp. FJAT-14222]QQP13040.1 DUF2321 domain-containing protein [Lysinibacillus agricola]